MAGASGWRAGRGPGGRESLSRPRSAMKRLTRRRSTMNLSQRTLGQRILVVDDEPQIARVLRRSLAARGYAVQVAGEGEEALEIFNAWAPDLVITDLWMPNMDGLELCRRIRATSQAPIIVLSVKGEERAKVEALDAGADDYVTKPFGIDELLARVRAALRRAPATAVQQVKVFQVGDFRADLESHFIPLSSLLIFYKPFMLFLSDDGRIPVGLWGDYLINAKADRLHQSVVFTNFL